MSLERLIQKRLNWVEANRENNFEDGIKRLLTDLYPDDAHFIYELLQNAEDAGATEVRFILKEDGAEFEHNGDRLFSLRDVDAITSIGVSAKRDDPTNIGQFGVGFKAVFAYTATPEITSGEFHFRIRDLVVPDTEGLSRSPLKARETRFILPFDNPKKPRERACAEVEKNLRELNENTLLFLSNIRKIEYLLPDSSLGFLECTKLAGNRIEIAVQHPNEVAPVPVVLLKFEKIVPVTDEEGKSKDCRIAIAFGMEMVPQRDENKSGEPSTKRPSDNWRIKPLFPGQVCIYFPAGKETSNLRFHMHAPFASTVARDSVRDCHSNNELLAHLAKLVAESMAAIRDQGLLKVGFLATLPNDRDNLPSFYKPVLDCLIEAFRIDGLTPMKRGGHAAAKGIFRGSAQLSNLISDDDMAEILGENYSPPLWVANPPQRNQREDNFLSMLDITEWTTEDFVGVLSNQSEPIMKMLARKTDEWHQQLYALLGEFLASSPSSPHNEAQNRKKQLAALKVVRKSDGTCDMGNKCYFPSDEVQHDELMPRVAKGVYTSGRNEDQQKKARTFLVEIGVREAGEAEQVEAILKARYSQSEVDQKAFKPDIEDIKRFIALLEKEPSQTNLFRDYSILKRLDGKWCKPELVYLDSPFYDTGLAEYYHVVGDKSPCRALSQDYKKCGVSLQKIGEFAKQVGARTSLGINREDGYYRIDYSIEHLDDVLESINLATSRLIWNAIVFKEHESSLFLSRLSRRDGRCSFHGDGDSSIVVALKQHEWVPQKTHTVDEFSFVRPADADSKLLPNGFPFDSGWKWLGAVGFGNSARQRQESEHTAAQRESVKYQLAEEVVKNLGFDSTEEAREMAELKRKDPEGYKKWQERGKGRPSFPTRTVTDPERRREKLGEQLKDASRKECDERERSVRITRKEIDPNLWLRNLYTNEAGQMMCQICKEEMPFRKRDGDYYFEAVEALSKDFFGREHEAQFLALCPLCAAMYKEFVKRDEEEMMRLKNALMRSEDLEIPLKLGELETSVRFVQIHRHDMGIILETEPR